MGKLAKPQRSKKHKKIKSVDPFYVGSRKDSRSSGLNQEPKTYDQEIPKKLKNLGFTIDGVRGGKVGKKSKNKFHKRPDGPVLHDNKFTKPLGAAPPDSKALQPRPKPKKDKVQATNKEANHGGTKTDKGVVDKKGKKTQISNEVFNEYVDNLKPVRQFVDPFNFKKKPGESERQFNQRVDTQAQRALVKSKIDDHFDVSDEKRMQQKMIKLKKGMSAKKKQRLKEKKLKKTESVKEKKKERFQGFNALQDHVEFGEVVHAPPTLSVRPKKALVSDEVDRPGRRMPELQSMIAANMNETEQQVLQNRTSQPHQPIKRKRGTSVKRRSLTVPQQRQADTNREDAIEAYRALKKKIKH